MRLLIYLLYFPLFILLFSCGDITPSIQITSIEKVLGNKDAGVVTLKIKISVKKDAPANYQIEQINFDVATSTLRSVEKVSAGSVIQKSPPMGTLAEVAALFDQTGSNLVLKKGESVESTKEIKLELVSQSQNGDPKKPIPFPKDTSYVQVALKIQPLNDELQNAGALFERSEYFPISF